jgi:AmmeMemoRadiSam system protein B
MFYPADAVALGRKVDDLLAAVPTFSGGRVRAAVSPHAGYPYSGLVAAHTFAAIAAGTKDGERDGTENAVRTVVIIAPSHVEYFPFSSVFDGDGYETPLGVVPVDRDAVLRITEGRDTVRASESGHMQEHLPRGEHSLEVQLPFLQRSLGRARVVPIVMGEQRWENCAELGAALAQIIDEDVVIVASSDLSHFHDDRRADSLDSAFGAALSTMSARDVYDAVRTGKCEACGAGPVVAALAAAQSIADREFHLLSRTHSGEVTGDRSSVVGYLSAVVTSPWGAS